MKKARPKAHVIFENLPFPAWRNGKPNKMARIKYNL
jgi:hypothetical protein